MNHAMHLMRMGRGGQKATPKELSFTVAACYSKKGWVAHQIRCMWFRPQRIASSKQGLHAKTQCLLEDKDTLIAVEEYMIGGGKLATRAGLAQAVTEYWSRLDRHAGEDRDSDETTSGPRQAQIDRGLSERTASEWMTRRGLTWTDLKKGVYKDSHERSYVFEYRQESFLPRLAELEPSFVQWTFPELETNPDAGYTQVYTQILPPGFTPRSPVTLDEGSFNSKDVVRRGWVRNAHMPFYNKGRGTEMMVSEYRTPGGNLQPPDYRVADYPLQPDRDAYHECTAIIMFGDGFWWTRECVADQLRDLAIPLFEKAYPGCQALFSLTTQPTTPPFFPMPSGWRRTSQALVS
jgi:hypothetical protein